MFLKIVLSVFFIYFAYHSIPWMECHMPDTVAAIDILGKAIKNDSITAIYNQTIFVTLKKFLHDFDKKLEDYYLVLARSRGNSLEPPMNEP